VQIDQFADGPIRLAIGHQQDHARPLGCSGFDGVGPHARFELRAVTSTEF
jgi:hypothetical protein